MTFVEVSVECTECGLTETETVHKSDAGSTISYGCRRCGRITEHETGPPRWFQ